MLLLTDYIRGENGLWAPFGLPNCTSSANEDAIPDGWGPNFVAVNGVPFPERMSRDALYPVKSSDYTWDGKTYDVPCTMAMGRAAAEDQVYDCPSGYVPRRDDSDDYRLCRQVFYHRHAIVFFRYEYICLFPHCHDCSHSRVPSMRIRRKSTVLCGSSRRSCLV